MHWVVHKTNLTTFTFFDLLVFVKFQALLVGVYVYFNHSPKRNLERSKLIKVMKIKGLKILHNTKTKWISMVVPSKVVLEEVKTILVKTTQNATANEFAIANYEELCELKLFWGLFIWWLCWKFCKVWAIMLRINKPSFTTF